MIEGLHISVVIPAYNEARHIQAVVRQIPPFVDRVVVVDDGSSDDTAQRVEQTRDPRIHVVRHRRNCGVGGAIVTGYRHAIQQVTDVVVVMAGDGQMDPADLPDLLGPIVEGRSDYVKGNRFQWPGVRQVMPPLRFWGGLCLSYLTRCTSGYPHIMDSQCGYTAATSRILGRVAMDSVYPRYGYPNDLLAHLHSAGARVEQVPVRPVYEGQTSGLHPVKAILPMAFVLGRSLVLRWVRECGS
jgi:glycosyltransferase involved in cell wall biosynthesis